jgi:regulator of replication initiation timing
MKPSELSPEVLAAVPPEVAALIRWLVDENSRLRAEVAALKERLNKNSSVAVHQ